MLLLLIFSITLLLLLLILLILQPLAAGYYYHHDDDYDDDYYSYHCSYSDSDCGLNYFYTYSRYSCSRSSNPSYFSSESEWQSWSWC